MSNARDKANIPALNFSSTGIDDNATSTAITINSSENVGIGKGTPVHKLEVAGEIGMDDGIPIFHMKDSTNNSSRIYFENSSSVVKGQLLYDYTSDHLRFNTNSAERMRIDQNGNVMINTTSAQAKLHIVRTDVGALNDGNSNGIMIEDTNCGICIGSATTGEGHIYFSDSSDADVGAVSYFHTNNFMQFRVNASERMRIDSSGNVGIGTSSPIDKLDIFGTADNTRHITFRINGNTADASTFIRGTRNNSDGAIDSEDTLFIRSRHNIHLSPSAGAGVLVIDGTTHPNQDNTFDLGTSSFRWDDVFATNGTIQTSDQNQKQSIQFLTTAEMNVAKRLSSLIKTFKWNSSVEEKGDSARTHTGIIAQDVQQAFTDEGLDANNYALFCSDTWWEKEYTIEATEDQETQTRMDIKQEATDGYTERTKLGVRYPELLSFIQAYNDQKFTELEARITTLEANNP